MRVTLRFISPLITVELSGEMKKKRLSVYPAFFDLYIYTRYTLQALPIKKKKPKNILIA